MESGPAAGPTMAGGYGERSSIDDLGGARRRADSDAGPDGEHRATTRPDRTHHGDKAAGEAGGEAEVGLSDLRRRTERALHRADPEDPSGLPRPSDVLRGRPERQAVPGRHPAGRSARPQRAEPLLVAPESHQGQLG